MEGDVMAVGKTLTIYLAADLKKFNQGMTQAQGGLQGFAGSLKNMLGPALIGAGIAVAGLATKMAVDGVNAALADEEAMRKLALTMDNLGLAHDTQKVEDYIYQLERSLGIADTELRPAYGKLARALGDTEKAQEALSLALDVSAGTEATLTQVTDALTKAYAGQTTGLSRLNSGIDVSIIRSGNMQAITEALSNTFRGQAAESADTLTGRMKVLRTAVDNLGEAFGRGLLTGVKSATEGTQDMVKALEDLEDEAESLGSVIALLGTEAVKAGGGFVDAYTSVLGFVRSMQGSNNVAVKGIAYLNPLGIVAGLLGDNLNAAADAADASGEAIGYTAIEARNAVPQWNNLTGAIRMTTQQYIDYLNANQVGNGILKDANKDYQDLAARQNKVNTFTSIAVEKTNTLNTSRGGASKVAEALNKAEQKLAETYEILNTKLDRTATKLSNQTGLLGEARQAVQDYASGIQQNLLSGIDLETAFTDQFDEAGQATGKTLLEGFNKQIAQAEYFGEVLNSIKAQGADQSLIEQIASLGPVTGAALAQQLIDDGLVKTMSDKWVGVQETTKGLAMSLVPEFLIAGQNSAEEMVKGTAQTLLERSQAFANMGKNIGKKVGAKFKAEFLADIAAAVKEVEAIQTAARAERIASETARQVAITDQQVGQALAKIIQRSDNRLGVQGVPVLA
jgi:uncharacterized protein